MFPTDVQRIYEMIRRKWSDVVFTGSQAMGVAKDNSDWDFVVCDELGFDIGYELGCEQYYSNTGEELSMRQCSIKYFTSMRFGMVNLIVDHRGSGVLANWAAATDYCTERAISDKSERIRVFESFGAG
jgi:hypothetical protein